MKKSHSDKERRAELKEKTLDYNYYQKLFE